MPGIDQNTRADRIGCEFWITESVLLGIRD